MSVVSQASERERLILAHLPQVHLLAGRLHRRCPACVDIEDLVSVGTLGLIQAVDRFQPERGLKLKTLAEHRIRGAMADYLRTLDPLSRQIRQFVRQREAMTPLLTARLGRPPEDGELADALALSIERYRRLEARARAAQVFSLESMTDRGWDVAS